jgi:hypothetical protein
MGDRPVTSAIAFFIFNRPASTGRVFDAIASAKPSQLLVIADGPRHGRADEQERCAATRAIIERVDWQCDVRTNYASVNLGCKRRVSSGLDWVFETVDEAIILEDDCLPDPTFFAYCDQLLEEYRNDDRIAMISGDNFQPRSRKYSYSYYYSRYTHIWGWASWRRAWRHYDVELRLWPLIRESEVLRDILGSASAARGWRDIFDAVYDGRIDTWDYQWTFACWMRNALSILPNVNLVENIGFGEYATHTTKSPPVSHRSEGGMHFPIRHPPYMVRDAAADRFTQFSVLGAPGFLNRAQRKARRLMGRM